MGKILSRFSRQPWTPSRVVETAKGLIHGKRYDFEKGSVDAFLGIPFAKSPVGELRFKKPVPPENWTTPLDCTKFGPRCPYDELFFENYDSEAVKNEDCLRLNVFAPEWSPESAGQPDGFAVMVFIHGGGFAIHSSAHYGDHGICDALCLKDVIVVCIQYRLGFFGFGVGEGVDSNVGLWDQTLALKWVQENIKAFGGNPNNVTVFGQSAGGACSDLLSISPHSRDLFQKVIPMAGTGLCSFSINDMEHIKNICYEYAVKMGYKPSEDSKETVHDFLRNLKPEKLQLGIFGKKTHNVNSNGRLDLTPCMDGDFFPKPLHELRAEAPKKSIITGVTEQEGLIFVGLHPSKSDFHNEVFKLIGMELNFHGVNDVEEIQKKIFDEYYKDLDLRDKRNKKDLLKVAINLVSDIYINNGTWGYADAMTKLNHTVYQYCFEYCNPNGFGLIGFVLPFKAATHGSELPYIFKKGVMTHFKPNDADLIMIDRMTTYFTNFAKYGDPNGINVPADQERWEPLTPENTLKYFSINLLKPAMKENLNEGRSVLWKSLIDQNQKHDSVKINGKL